VPRSKFKKEKQRERVRELTTSSIVISPFICSLSAYEIEKHNNTLSNIFPYREGDPLIGYNTVIR